MGDEPCTTMYTSSADDASVDAMVLACLVQEDVMMLACVVQEGGWDEDSDEDLNVQLGTPDKQHPAEGERWRPDQAESEQRYREHTFISTNRGCLLSCGKAVSGDLQDRASCWDYSVHVLWAKTAKRSASSVY